MSTGNCPGRDNATEMVARTIRRTKDGESATTELAKPGKWQDTAE